MLISKWLNSVVQGTLRTGIPNMYKVCWLHHQQIFCNSHCCTMLLGHQRPPPMGKIKLHIVWMMWLPWWLKSKGYSCQCRRQGDWGSVPGLEDLLEKEMTTYSSIQAWRIPWTEGPGGLQSMGSWRVRRHWATNAFNFTHCEWYQIWVSSQFKKYLAFFERMTQKILIRCNLLGLDGDQLVICTC